MVRIPDTQEQEIQTVMPSASRGQEVVEWTPLLGMIRGTMACAAVSVVLGTGWCAVARFLPEASVTHLRDGVQESMGPFFMTGLLGLLSTWILFLVMHRASSMVGGLCPVIVVFFVVLLTLAKHVVLVKYGVHLPSGFVIGWPWMEPLMIVKANVGTWVGLILGVVVFRTGESITDMFST